jgi:RNA-directed DNA polymerase
MAKFGLELHPEKTRLIRFGRFAAGDRDRDGEPKPETFNFLGFTHFCTKTRKGRFTVGRQSIAKRLQAKVQDIREGLRRRLHWPVEEVGQWLRSVLHGYYQYHAVPGNMAALNRMHDLTEERGWRPLEDEANAPGAR